MDITAEMLLLIMPNGMFEHILFISSTVIYKQHVDLNKLNAIIIWINTAFYARFKTQNHHDLCSFSIEKQKEKKYDKLLQNILPYNSTVNLQGTSIRGVDSIVCPVLFGQSFAK